jgi:integrase
MGNVEDPSEVVDAEIVDDTAALAVIDRTPATRPDGFPSHVDQHTIVRPGKAPEPEPVYTERDFIISEQAAEQAEEQAADNTTATYASRRRAFRAWCAEQQRVAMPCTTATLVEYVDHLIRQHKAPSTISVSITAIVTEHPDGRKPGTDMARKKLRNYKASSAKAGRVVRKAPGIRRTALQAMVSTCDPDHPVDVRDAAALTLGWWILARRSEVTNLDIGDITMRDDHMQVRIRFSKTDQGGEGAIEHVYGSTDPLTDPLRWMRAWLAILAARGVTKGPLIRALTTTGRFQDRSRVAADAAGDRDRVQPRTLNAIARRRAQRAQLPNWKDITAHGLRRGPANELAEGKVSEDQIEEAGRWTKGSGTVRRTYIDPASKAKGSAMRGLAEDQGDQQ